MDHFGIGTAIRAAAHFYCQVARRTGRTTLLVESVKTGDRVVFVHPKQQREFERLCKERKVEVECIVVDPSNPGALFREHGTSEGRTIFDHTWVEQFYLMALERTAGEIDHLERETSGYGAAHRETARKFREFRKHDRIGDPNGAVIDYLFSPRKDK